MENRIVIRVFAILLFATVCEMSEVKNTYIVHMENLDEMKSTGLFDHVKKDNYFESSLKSVSDTVEMLYAYDTVMHGFSIRLTPEEARALQDLPQVISVLHETKYKLHTTRTPLFLGLEQHADMLPKTKQLSDIIVGVFDTGVWPESDNFNDNGLPVIPRHWKGECETGTNFSTSMCNKKLVGARFFSKGYEADPNNEIDWNWEFRSPRDDSGHGTHTSTTAVGSAVSGASMFGYAYGTARGMAPQARVAVYKVCWIGGCFGSDILAAMEKAIKDNVNVMSLSLGSSGDKPYFDDVIATGAFAAMEKGILVSCSAGNGGPKVASLENTAPWITTVGAGTLDRDFPATVILGNGKQYIGASLYSGKESLSGKFIPFVYAGNATNNETSGNLCLPGMLIPEKVKGKIVLCERGINARVEKGLVVKKAGGKGMILANTAATGEELVADPHFCPAAAVGAKAGNAMKLYLSTHHNATTTIYFTGTKLNVQPSPVVASFSSRGPNTMNPEILKPDLIAPGVNILAGWTGNIGPTDLDSDTRLVHYNIISGTSMSCPHVSGLAALLKAAHPDWSPAAIRSALMTTAYTTYKNGNQILDIATGKASTPFDSGAGHVNPILSLDPGLIYDLNGKDYLNFLCALKYTPKQIRKLAGKTNFTCKRKAYSVNYLNYPSFAVSIPSKMKGTTMVEHRRELTNVGEAGTYRVKIISPSQLFNISVVPGTLTFNRLQEKKSYTVTFRMHPNMQTNQFGSIEWKHDKKKYVVRSPVAVSWT